MIPALTYVFMAMAGAYALFAVVEFLRRRMMGQVLFYGAFGLTALTLVLLIVSVVEMIIGYRPGDVVIFIGYLLTTLLVMPAVFVWASLNRDRFGTLSLGVGAAVLVVLFMRLLQVWQGATI